MRGVLPKVAEIISARPTILTAAKKGKLKAQTRARKRTDRNKAKRDRKTGKTLISALYTYNSLIVILILLEYSWLT
jgi:hypothetical protein